MCGLLEILKRYYPLKAAIMKACEDVNAV